MTTTKNAKKGHLIWALSACFLAISPLSAGAEGADKGPIFADATEQAGIRFVHFNGMTGKYFIPEVTGQGAALLDFDRDGDLDAYLVQGSLFDPEASMADAVFPLKGEEKPLDRLYRNDLKKGADGTALVHFTDVTEKSGIRDDLYGMGVAVGDYDRDGWPDLYVTNMGSNRLFHNNKDGTFADVTAAAGVDDSRWSTSATWFDYDADGWLDLFVANYVDFKTTYKTRCYSKSSAQDFCGPDAYDAVPDRLFRNLGNGTFEDATSRAGLGTKYGAGLGVVTSDLNGDGRIDLYVANDGDANQLWIGQGDGKFKDEALWSGAALNASGSPEAGMGVDAGDVDNDGDDDLFMVHIMGETNTLLINDGTGLFEDRTNAYGLGASSLSYTGFGAGWIDYDNDGWLDLLITNGEVRIIEELAREGDPYPCRQVNHLFHNTGKGSFFDVSSRAGSAFQLLEVSRGTALGDVDNDGDTDVLMANSAGPARLLLNQVGQSSGWLGLRLRAPDDGSIRVGSRVEVTLANGSVLHRQARVDGNFCSSRDPRVLVGVGGAPRVERVRVRWWPSGQVEEWGPLETGQYVTLEEGAGRPPGKP